MRVSERFPEKNRFVNGMAPGPETRITAMPPSPGGVA
jgi:hypothetical protein